MHIVNTSASESQARQMLRALPSPNLLAQEITQKASINALIHLQRIGITEANVAMMLESLQSFGALVSEECLRRGLAIVEHPGADA